MNNETINTELEESRDLLNDNSMLDENGKPAQIAAKTSVGNRAFFNSLPGASNHEKISLLRKEYEKAVSAKSEVIFADNVSVINNCLESIKSQVDAISKGIRAEESRIRKTFIEPLSDKIAEYENEVEDIAELTTSVERLSKENDKLTKELDKLKDLKEDNEKTIAEQVATINDLTSESRNLMKENKSINEKLESLTNDIEGRLSEQRNSYEEALTSQRNSYEEDLTSKSKEIDGLNKRIESLNLELDQLSKTEETLRSEIKDLKSDKLDVENNYKKQILDLNVAKNNAEFKAKSLEMEKDKLKSENSNMSIAIANFKTNQTNIENTMKLLNIDKSTLEVKVKELEGLVSLHNENINNKQAQVNNLEEQLQGEAKLRQERELEISKLQITLNDQAATIEKLQKMLDALNSTENETDTPVSDGKSAKAKRK